MRYSTRLVAASTWTIIDQLIVAFTVLTTLSAIDKDPARFAGGWNRLLASQIPLPQIICGVAAVALWAGVARAIGLHRNSDQGIFAETARIACGAAASGLALYLCLSAAKPGAPAADAGAFAAAAAFGTMVIARAAVASLAGRAWARVRKGRVAIIAGSGSRALRMYRQLRTRRWRSHRVLGFVDNKAAADCPPEIGSMLLGGVADLEELLLKNVVDEIYIALPAAARHADIRKIAAICRRAGVEYKYPMDLLPEGTRGQALEEELVSIRPATYDSRLFIKRCIDIIASGAALLVLSPVLLLIAIAIKATSSGPVIFSQSRYGLGRRQFKMYKFRSMVVNAEALMRELESRNEATGPVFKIQRDPRVTRVGYWLRRTSLDELPQLFNVLIGDMSLVGPRPMTVRDVALFSEAWLMRRFSVRPGITCLWQVNGRSSTTFDRWMELDMRYIDNWSLMLDTKILAATIPAIVRGTGAM